MDDMRAGSYVPWADDVLLPGESPYALLNKLAWFSRRGPVQLLRDLVFADHSSNSVGPKSIDYGKVISEWNSSKAAGAWPVLNGNLSKYFEPARFKALVDYPAGSRSRKLRFCPECIGIGMHFLITQLAFIEYCPYHHRRLVSCCQECGAFTAYECVGSQDAFSCRECSHSFLTPGLTDLRANRRRRWMACYAHTELEKALHHAPVIYAPETCPYQAPSGHDVKSAMTEVLALGPAMPLDRDLQVPLVTAVKVVRDASGRPSLERQSRTNLQLDGDERCSLTAEDAHAFAQMRVGAWALREYGAHLACICAAKRVMMYRSLRSEDHDIHSSICCVGKGFAVWDVARRVRTVEALPAHLWSVWGMESASDKVYASYVMEKACLSSAISTFLRHDSFEMGEWERQKFALKFSSWRRTGGQSNDQALLWYDLRHVDFSDVCDMPNLDDGSRREWLIQRYMEVAAPVELSSSAAACYMAADMAGLIATFSAKSREEFARKASHEMMSRRSFLT